MYDFHYNFIKRDFDAELLFTDTNGLTYEIKSENVFKEFFKWKDLFDFSNYSKDSKFFDKTNKKVIRKMKDEFGGIIVKEFVELKSKLYSIKKIDSRECNPAKGVSIATEFNKFKDLLFGKRNYQTQNEKNSKQKHNLAKYLCHVLAMKDMCQIMEFIRWLNFIKIVLQIVKRLKKTVIKKKRLEKIVIKKIVIIEKIVIKKIAIIEKHCDNLKKTMLVIR